MKYITFYVNADREVCSSVCDCVSGIVGMCKHISALAEYINSENHKSKTSLECVWSKPNVSNAGKVKYCKGKKVEDLFPRKRLKVNVTPLELNKNDLASISCPLMSSLKHELNSESHWICQSILNSTVDRACNDSEKNNCKNGIIFCLEQQLMHPSYSNNINISKDIEKMYTRSEAEIIQTCIDTLGQSNCRQWFIERRHRITASSHAHRVKTRLKDIDSLAEDLLKEKTLKGVAKRNCEYGIQNEEIARDCYEKKYNVTVLKCGSVIHRNQSWLLASPDGLVVNNGSVVKVLEIKCPSSCKTKYIVDREGNINVNYLKYDEKKDVILKPSHQYYTQCQMLLYCTGLTICDLFIYSPVQCYCIPVQRDPQFISKCVLKLEMFYFNHYLPRLLQVGLHV